MIKIERVHSELTGRMEAATICPELRSEFGKSGRPIRDDEPNPLIVEGTADIDLLAMHSLCYDADGRILPVELATCDREHRKDPIVREPGVILIPEQAKNKMLRSWIREHEKRQKKLEKKQRLIEHKDRIRMNEARWNKCPDDDEIEELKEIEPDLFEGIAKLMLKQITLGLDTVE